MLRYCLMMFKEFSRLLKRITLDWWTWFFTWCWEPTWTKESPRWTEETWNFLINISWNLNMYFLHSMTIFYDFLTTVQKYAFKIRTENVENKIYKHFMKRNLFTYMIHTVRCRSKLNMKVIICTGSLLQIT